MDKIISSLIRAVDIAHWQADNRLTSLSKDFEIIVTYDLYKVISASSYLLQRLADSSISTFMGHVIHVSTDFPGYSFWIADRQEIKDEGSY